MYTEKKWTSNFRSQKSQRVSEDANQKSSSWHFTRLQEK